MARREDRLTIIGRMNRRKDRTSFIGSIWPWPGVQQEKPQKKSHIKHCLTILNTARAICWKYARYKGDSTLHMLEVCEVRSSSFLKLMIITHIEMMQIPYLVMLSILLSTSASYKLFFGMFKDML